MTHILEVLIKASEKAARVAKSCLENPETLLVAEKCETEANVRFFKDFKTIADVLAQESAKALIVSNFPDLISHIRGEECSEINGVSIGLREDVENTIKSLSCLIPSTSVTKMAHAAHTDVNLDVKLPPNLPNFDLNDLGVWIDPIENNNEKIEEISQIYFQIDATAEFIAGVRGESKDGHGLSCVTVLIGAYLRSTGEPIIGVINQPFFENGKGRIIWGFHYENVNKWSENESLMLNDKIVQMSRVEKSEIIDKFKNSGWLVKTDPGAGQKLMKVALGEASAYVVSQGTTFRWDTCAPHAIILARGGNVLSYKELMPISYNDEQDLDTKEYCNKDGIIAYCNESVLDELKSIIS